MVLLTVGSFPSRGSDGGCPRRCRDGGVSVGAPRPGCRCRAQVRWRDRVVVPGRGGNAPVRSTGGGSAGAHRTTSYLPIREPRKGITPRHVIPVAPYVSHGFPHSAAPMAAT